MEAKLKTFADELCILKLKDKVRFLRGIKNYALLFDPKNPRDIPGCSVDERMGFYYFLTKNIFYQLRGHNYGSPKYNRVLRSEKQRIELSRDDICHGRISDGLSAYVQASDQERKQFERRVKMPKLFACFLRPKSVLDYNFR